MTMNNRNFRKIKDVQMKQHEEYVYFFLKLKGICKFAYGRTEEIASQAESNHKYNFYFLLIKLDSLKFLSIR